jgi:hypothetical protein
MLSFKIVCSQEGQLDKENFGTSKLIPSLYPGGILAIIAHLFYRSRKLQREGPVVLSMPPGGMNAVDDRRL